MQIAAPSLHISLGIFHHLFKLYESQCHELDLELARHSVGIQSSTSTSFNDYCIKLKVIQTNEKEIQFDSLLKEADTFKHV